MAIQTGIFAECSMEIACLLTVNFEENGFRYRAAYTVVSLAVIIAFVLTFGVFNLDTSVSVNKQPGVRF